MTITTNGIDHEISDYGAYEAAKHGVARSPHWESFKHEFSKTNSRRCAYCDSPIDVQLHHEQPFHINPQRELDPTNLIWLCEEVGSNHHLHVGHCGDWKKFNPRVREDCLKNQKMIKLQRDLENS